MKKYQKFDNPDSKYFVAKNQSLISEQVYTIKNDICSNEDGGGSSL